MKTYRTERRRIQQRKQRILRRQQRARYQVRNAPVIAGGRPQYEVAERVRGTAHGGIGVMHSLVERLGLQAAIDSRLNLLCRCTGPIPSPIMCSTWGYHPLVVSLANTQEVLRVRNRPGNRPSHEAAWQDLDESIALCRNAGFRDIRMTGDTDFTQTAHLHRWNDAGDVTFVFGMDCSPTLHVLADEIPAEAFRELQRRAKCQMKTKPRTKPET